MPRSSLAICKTLAGEEEVMRKDKNSSQTALRAVYNWLFRGTQVYRLSEPDRVLTTLRINWDAQTTDLKDQDGTVFYGVPWTDLEFLRPQDYHLAGDDD